MAVPCAPWPGLCACVCQAWQDGGYSDDLLLAALCTRKGLGIAVPSFALFPQWYVRLARRGAGAWPRELAHFPRVV